MEVRPQSAVQIATIVVVNIICWMVMIAAIGLGARYLDHCPVQPNIPIYLIVLGAASVLSLSLSYTRCAFDDGFACILCSACTICLYMFAFGWFIAGTTWIYTIYPPDYSPRSDRYCHKTTYQFAFVVTTLQWVVIALMLLCCCCFAVLTCCRTVIAGHRLIPSRNTFYGATSDVHEPTAGDV